MQDQSRDSAASGATAATLLYVADPMCSWCWGFAPAIREIADRHAAPAVLQLVAGGLFPDTTATMSPRMRAVIQEHWLHVAEATGQPFNHAFFDRESFVYDTEPACRALVAARALAPDDALAYLHALHAAFYRDNRDITGIDALAEVAAALGLDPNAFRDAWDSAAVRERTREDFALSRELGVSGFPSLVGYHRGQVVHLAAGCEPLDTLLPRLERWKRGWRAAPG